jgi:hypothetical protein
MAVNARLECANASTFECDADLIFTHPYAPIPAKFSTTPMIINLYEGKGSRKRTAEGWIGAPLHRLSTWGAGGANTVYVANVPAIDVDLKSYRESHWESVPGRGWFPLSMCTMLLGLYGWRGMTVYDGFMGRGTVGRAAKSLGMNFIGVDISPERVELARRYIETGE